MTKLTDLESEEFTASDETVEAAVEAAATDLDMAPDEVSEAVACILDSGSGRITNEGVAGAAVSANADTADDPRLEALEIFRLRQQL